MVTAIVVTFSVFKGLEKAKVIEKVKIVLTDAFGETKAVAQNCTPKILKFNEFWLCLKDPGKYKPEPQEQQQEQQFEQGLTDLLDFGKYDETTDPYAENAETQTTSETK